MGDDGVRGWVMVKVVGGWIWLLFEILHSLQFLCLLRY